MSRFSSLEGQSSALITLERQRLEAKIGQLRREVESPGDAGQRRLEKKVPLKAQRSKVAFPPRSADKKTKPRKENPSSNEAPSVEEDFDDPTPSSPSRPGSAGPSCEIAWLMQVSEVMEAEGAEAKAFLAKHGLDRYCALLAEKGLDSLKALRSASESDLAEVGLPETVQEKIKEAVASLPQEDLDSQQLTKEIKWHKFGKAPPGWRSVEEALPPRDASKGVVSMSVGTTHEMACGGDDPIEASWLLGESTDDRPRDVYGQLLHPDDGQEVTLPDSENDAADVRFFNVEPTTAAARQSSKDSADSGKVLAIVPEETEKICCYGCFKQAWVSQAVEVEDPVISGPRLFCSDACSSSFRKELEKRATREQQRSSLWQAVPTAEAKEVSSRPGSAASKAAAATESAMGRPLTQLNEVPDFEPSSRPGSSANISANAAATALGRPLSAALRPPSGRSRPTSGYVS